MIPWPRMWVAGPPVISSRLVESANAVARPITVFAAPGPIDVTAAIGRPAGAPVAVGHVHGALLVEDLDEGDRRAVLQKAVEQRPDAVTRDAGRMRDAVLRQGASDDLAAGKGGHGSS